MSNAREIKSRITRTAALRHHFWCIGDAAGVARSTEALDDLWHEWRRARAADEAEREPLQYKPIKVVPAIDRFINDRCSLDTAATSSVAGVYTAFADWAQTNGEDEITAKRLTAELRNRGVTSARTKRARLYQGVRVTDQAETLKACA